MSKLGKKMKTKENKDYWKGIELAKQEIKKWPEWKKKWAKAFSLKRNKDGTWKTYLDW